MSELERAQAHLRNCQSDLRSTRCSRHFTDYRHEESAVLAALSWLWEAQQRWKTELLTELRQTVDIKGYRKAKRAMRFS